MGRTACTEPQCLYKGALYFYLYTCLSAHIYGSNRRLPLVKVLEYLRFLLRFLIKNPCCPITNLQWVKTNTISRKKDINHIEPANEEEPYKRTENKLSPKTKPASWSSGQGLWLLIMRSRVRFPVLPWEFFLAGKDSRGDHGLGS